MPDNFEDAHSVEYSYAVLAPTNGHRITFRKFLVSFEKEGIANLQVCIPDETAQICMWPGRFIFEPSRRENGKTTIRINFLKCYRTANHKKIQDRSAKLRGLEGCNGCIFGRGRRKRPDCFLASQSLHASLPRSPIQSTDRPTCDELPKLVAPRPLCQSEQLRKLLILSIWTSVLDRTKRSYGMLQSEISAITHLSAIFSSPKFCET